MGFYMKAYLDLKEHIAMGVSPEMWLIQRKEFANQSMSTQYRELGSLMDFLEWLKKMAREESLGLEFAPSLSVMVGGSRSEGRY